MFDHLPIKFIYDQVHGVIHIAIMGFGKEVFAFQVERDFGVIS
jgi:hypothetical protein